MGLKKRRHEELDDESLDINPARYNASVVKISKKTFIPDIIQPWNPPKCRNFIGSGSIIDKNKGHILTCAHVADARSEYLVQLANDSTEYPAKLMASEADCDLAIICVEDPAYLKKVWSE